MAHIINDIFIDAARLERIRNHSFLVYLPDEHKSKKFIIDDNLEMGKLEVYENITNVCSFQKFTASPDRDAGVVSVADIIIGAMWQQETVMIHSISCKYEYEYLIQPMIGQVVHFAAYYECYQSIWISEREMEKWFKYDGLIFSQFHKKGKSYTCKIR